MGHLAAISAQCIGGTWPPLQGKIQGRSAPVGQARAGFLESLDLEPLHGQPGVKTCPSKVFAARCEQYLSHPPSGWDGVFTATEK